MPTWFHSRYFNYRYWIIICQESTDRHYGISEIILLFSILFKCIFFKRKCIIILITFTRYCVGYVLYPDEYDGDLRSHDVVQRVLQRIKYINMKPSNPLKLALKYPPILITCSHSTEFALHTINYKYYIIMLLLGTHYRIFHCINSTLFVFTVNFNLHPVKVTSRFPYCENIWLVINIERF